ncbi:F-box/LRR-repeat protein At3g48880-like [Zingiber officinale]|nr:F-box/LRR-repeat protein At3g48880-like [Zingiber officinale]
MRLEPSKSTDPNRMEQNLLSAGFLPYHSDQDLAVAVPFVCKSWYRASLDPSCWRRLNFRSLDFTPWSPFSRAFALRYRLLSPLSFSAFLRFALHRSCCVVDQLAFPLSSAVSIHDLAYASVKCLRLKALALPDNLMLEDDLRIPELVWRWKDLEHLEMETKPSSFLEAVAEIGRNCPRFVGLKVRGLIRREDAKALARCLPELKHLELSKSYLTKDELLVVIGGCRKLETLIVKDCLGFQADDEILKLVSRIERFEHEGSTLVYSYTCSNIGSRSALQVSFFLSTLDL